MDRDVIIVFVGRMIDDGASLERATQEAWAVSSSSAAQLKYIVPVTHRHDETGRLQVEVRKVFEITGYYPLDARYGFQIVPSERPVVIELPRMYGPFRYMHSEEVFEGKAPPTGQRTPRPSRSGGKRPTATGRGPSLESSPPICPIHNMALRGDGKCDSCNET